MICYSVEWRAVVHLMHLLYVVCSTIHLSHSAGLPEASFNDKRCVSGVVCPTDPLIFTCNVTGSDADRTLIDLPSGGRVALLSDNTILVEETLPDGITVQFHNATVSNGVADYILSLAIERASLLNSDMIQCSDSSLTPVIDEASCPVATDPDSPQSLTQDVPANTETSLVVQWQIPSYTGGNGISIISYNITVDDSPHDTISDDGSDLYTYNITGLRYNTEYSVAVTATNECGFTSVPAIVNVNIEARVPPQPILLLSPVLYCDIPLSDDRPVMINWLYGEEEESVVYPGNEVVTIELDPGDILCSDVTVTDTSCTTTITRDDTYTISVTISNDLGPSQPAIFTFDSQPLQVEELILSGVPAITVRLNHLCRTVIYTVSVSFGVREEDSECVLQQNSTARLLPGESVVFVVNISSLPLGYDQQQYCFLVYELGSGDIEGDITVPSTSSDDRDMCDSISTSSVVAITFTITLLVILPVGVAIGMFVLWCVWKGQSGNNEKIKNGDHQLEGANVAAIYEEPATVETEITLSENQAYGHINTQRRRN